MKIPRFFQEGDLNHALQSAEVFELSPANHRHAVQVLRLKPSEPLIVFNGQGGEYFAHLESFSKRKSFILLDSFSPINRESLLSITLVLAMIKPDKMDFALQKAVELGVTKIQPMYTERSVIKIKSNRLEKKMQHWQGVITGACEQSGRTRLPVLEGPLSFDQCLNIYTKNSACIVMLPEAKVQLKTLTLFDKGSKKDKELSLFIGPEGGFSDNEEQQIQAKNIISINFGARILRAETAVISGITACQLQWGDL